jgi:hypothetical protein
MKNARGGAPAGAPIEGFEFVDAGRRFTCCVEVRSSGASEGWWWFRVAPDARGQRYAPFRAAPDDTREDVRARIVAYYDDLQARLAAPATNRYWGRRSGGARGTPAPRAAAPSSAAPIADAR